MVTGVETPGPHRDRGGSSPSNAAAEQTRSLFWRVHRLAPARLTSRIVLLNIAGLIVLVARHSLFQSVPPGPDRRARAEPDAAGQYHRRRGRGLGHRRYRLDRHRSRRARSIRRTTPPPMPTSFAISISRSIPRMPVRSCAASSPTRRSVPASIDPDGNLVVDSRYLYGRGEIIQRELPPLDAEPDSFWMRWWKQVNDWLFTNDYPHQKDYGADNGKEFPEVLAALNGASVSVVRVNDRTRSSSPSRCRSSASAPCSARSSSRPRAARSTMFCSPSARSCSSPSASWRSSPSCSRCFLPAPSPSRSAVLPAAAERVRRGVNKRVEIPDFTAAARRDRPSVRRAARHDDRALQSHRGDRGLCRRRLP